MRFSHASDPRLLAYATALIAFVVLASLGIVVGPRMGGDSSGYIDGGRMFWANLLAGRPGDVSPTQWLYAVPMLVIGGGSWLLGTSFPPAFVALNCGVFAVMVWLQVRTWQRLVPVNAQDVRGLIVAVACGLGLITGLPYVPYWNYYILSDVLFLGWVGFFWFALVRTLVNELRHGWSLTAAIAAAAMLMRPTAFMLVGFWVMARLYAASRGRSAARWIVPALFVAPALYALLVFPWLVYEKGRGAPVPAAMAPALLVSLFHDGVVVGARFETYRPKPVEYGDFVAIAVARLAYFYIPVRAGYSALHKILSVGWACLAVALISIGWNFLRRTGGAYASVATLALLFCWLFALGHAMIVVDYDWRYQLPPMIAAWTLGGCGVILLGRHVSTRRSDDRSVRAAPLV
jgi:hypothetical protein